jgi:hypothetical protein
VTDRKRTFLVFPSAQNGSENKNKRNPWKIKRKEKKPKLT